MKNILFTILFLLLGSNAYSGQIDKSDFKVIGNNKPVVKKQVKFQKFSLYPKGYHEHQCPYDGTRWGHGESSFGNVKDHTCPRCGRVIWDKSSVIRLRQ